MSRWISGGGPTHSFIFALSHEAYETTEGTLKVSLALAPLGPDVVLRASISIVGFGVRPGQKNPQCVPLSFLLRSTNSHFLSGTFCGLGNCPFPPSVPQGPTLTPGRGVGPVSTAPMRLRPSHTQRGPFCSSLFPVILRWQCSPDPICRACSIIKASFQ